MRIRKPFWIVALALVFLAGVAMFLVLRGRDEVTQNVAVTQCQALDHLVQVLEYTVSTSETLNDREKEFRIHMYENFRDEQERTVDSRCRDPLDPDVIAGALRSTLDGS